MTRLSIALCSIALAACGGSNNNTTVDAAGSDDVGFNKPTMAVHANTEGSDGTYTDVGLADLSCLGTASTDTTTTVAVTLATVVKDFQNQTAIPSAMVTAFAGINVTTPFDTQTADANGNVTVTIPVGTMRFGFDMNATNQFPTLLLNQKVDPSTATQTLDEIQSVSAATAATLSALIGEARMTGTGVVAGAVRDCQAREMSNFVVTVSSTPATATPIAGAQAFYFVNSLPARHNVLDSAGQDALFMVIQLPVAATAYVQAWGYTTDAAVGGDMTLLSQLQAPVLADTVVTGSFEPVRQ